MNISLKLALITSSLILSGCFNSPTENQNDEQIEFNLLWEYAYDLDGGAPFTKPTILDTMIITSGDIKITSLDFRSGDLIWKTPFDHHGQLTNKTFGTYEDIIVGNITREVLAWNKYDGVQLWSIPIADSLSWSLSRGITSVNDHFLIPGQGRHHYFVSPEGELNIEILDVRSYETSVSGNILFMGQRIDDRGVVSAMNINTMELIWRFEPGQFGFPSREAPIVENGIVYVGTTGGPTGSRNGFFALDASTGEEIWRREGILTYSAELVGNYVYVNDAAGIYKLDKSDGRIVWYADFEAGAGTAPIAYGYGYLYAPHAGRMYIVDAETGEWYRSPARLLLLACNSRRGPHLCPKQPPPVRFCTLGPQGGAGMRNAGHNIPS